MEKILVILPTYNEKDNIRKIISEILKEGDNVEVLVIDDNSPDGTGDIVSDIIKNNSRVHLLTRPGKLGLGTAYVEGFKYALSHDYELIFEMDADFSHDPKEIPRFLEEIKDSDVVVGSRYISGVNVVNWPMSRLLLSWLANLYTRIVAGMPLKDATSGFKCIKRKVLEDINLEHIQSDGYSFQIEIHYRVWRKGFKIKEIPIIFIDRRIGVSKMNTGIINEAALLVWKLRFMRIFGKI